LRFAHPTQTPRVLKQTALPPAPGGPDSDPG
jgi:hypothetical protein